jgi:hypothetical protein
MSTWLLPAGEALDTVAWRVEIAMSAPKRPNATAQIGIVPRHCTLTTTPTFMPALRAASITVPYALLFRSTATAELIERSPPLNASRSTPVVECPQPACVRGGPSCAVCDAAVQRCYAIKLS